MTAAQLGLPSPDTGLSTIVISDGRILDANLRHLGLDQNWLADRLRENGAEDAAQVFIMTVNGAGQTERLEKDIDRPAAGKIRAGGKDKKDGKGKGRLICTTINPSA